MEEDPPLNQEPNLPPPVIPPVSEFQMPQPVVSNNEPNVNSKGKEVGAIRAVNNGRPKRLILLVFGLATLLMIGIAGYFILSKSPEIKKSAQKLVSVSKIGENKELSLSPEKVQPTPKTVGGTEGWAEYKKEGVNFSFKYPSELAINEYNPGFVKIRQDGPNQAGHEEFVDGIYLWFRSIDAGGLTLKQAADETYMSLKGDTNVSFPIVGSLGGVSGYTFRAKGSVGLDYYYLPLTQNLYLEVVDGTKDPASQGFSQTAQKILATLVINP